MYIYFYSFNFIDHIQYIFKPSCLFSAHVAKEGQSTFLAMEVLTEVCVNV